MNKQGQWLFEVPMFSETTHYVNPCESPEYWGNVEWESEWELPEAFPLGEEESETVSKLKVPRRSVPQRPISVQVPRPGMQRSPAGQPPRRGSTILGLRPTSPQRLRKPGTVSRTSVKSPTRPLQTKQSQPSAPPTSEGFKSALFQGDPDLLAVLQGRLRLGRPGDPQYPAPIKSQGTGVIKVQQALVQLGHPTGVNGRYDEQTYKTVYNYKLQYGIVTETGYLDGIVGSKTIRHLDNALMQPEGFPGCSMQQSNIIRADLIRAKQMLNVVLNRLRTSSIQPSLVDFDTKQKVRRIFHIDMLVPLTDMPTEALKYADLMAKYRQLRASLDKQFFIRCEPAGLFAAWVSPDIRDETLHITPSYFQQTEDQRAVTVIHERAHTVLNLPGNPHPGTPDVIINMAPDDDIGLSYEDAIRNAYCYEWLTHALQLNYDPNRFRDRITPQHY